MYSVTKPARAAILLAVVLVVGMAGVALGSVNSNVGQPLIIGNITQTSGSKSTQLTATSSGNAFKMQNNGTGSGLRGVATGGGNGVSVTSTNAQGNGVFAENTAPTQSVSNESGAAIWALGNQNLGVYARTDNGASAGMIGDDRSGSDVGSGMGGLTDHGVGAVGVAFADPNTPNLGPGEGGLFVTYALGDYGVVAEGCAAAPPSDPGGPQPCTDPSMSWAGDFEGAVNINGDLTITGTCTGCALASLAINGTKQTIRQGQAVAIVGVRAGVAGVGSVLMVGPAGAGQQVIGVADRAMRPVTATIRVAASRRPDNSVMPAFASRQRTVYVVGGTGVKPGQMMRVITHGLFTFGRVSAAGGAVRAGDSLGAGSEAGVLVRRSPITVAGVSFLAPGTSVGYALGSVTSGSGIIAIFVSPH